MKPLFYAETPPSPALAAHVHAHWRFEARLPPGETLDHHVWPDGCVSVFVALQGGGARALVVGPSTEARRVPTHGGTRCRGVRLWPDVAGAVLGVAPASLRDVTAPAAALLGDAAAALDEAAQGDDDAGAAVLERWIAARLRDAPPIDALVRRAVLAIVETRGAMPVARLAEHVGLSRRQLERRFHRAVGLTPKEYARVRRVRETIALALDPVSSWSRLAAEIGFADQSHLVREVGGVTGLTPVALGERLGMIEHGDVKP